jgi:hypothetical protein
MPSSTAAAIAREVGLIGSPELILEGSQLPEDGPGSLRMATAMTRSPREAIASTSADTVPADSPQSGKTDSGAPLTKSVFPTMTDSRRRLGSNANRRAG